ncbi:hypothetical protein Tco_0066678 [Tanacetum coccineum]
MLCCILTLLLMWCYLCAASISPLWILKDGLISDGSLTAHWTLLHLCYGFYKFKVFGSGFYVSSVCYKLGSHTSSVSVIVGASDMMFISDHMAAGLLVLMVHIFSKYNQLSGLVYGSSGELTGIDGSDLLMYGSVKTTQITSLSHVYWYNDNVHFEICLGMVLINGSGTCLLASCNKLILLSKGF